MAIKRFKPTSPARRFMTVNAYTELSGDKPERSLLHDKRKTGGRNNQGKISVRHIGGGNRIKYRIIDFKRNKDGVVATVKSIQYDPNRSAHIALLANHTMVPALKSSTKLKKPNRILHRVIATK